MNGKLLDVPTSDYHASDCISHSKLEVFRKRPLLFKKRFIDKSLAPESSAAFVIGQAAHTAILEPTEFAHRYVCRPDGIDRRTKDGKAAYEAFAAANDGKDVLERDDWLMVQKMAESVKQHPIAAQLLGEGQPEVTWRADSHLSLPHPLQCRTDWINENGGYIADLKTIDSLEGSGVGSFQRNLVNFGYHRQAGFYTDVLAKCGNTALDFYFIVVEKREPFGCVVFKLDEEAMQLGWRESIDDLKAMSGCFIANDWPNLSTQVQKLNLPKWYLEGKQ